MSWLMVLGDGVAIVGAALVLVAAVGLHRFAEADVRLHVAAKASSGGILLVLVGLGLRAGDAAAGIELALTGVFLVLTIPIATHALARARLGPVPDDDTTTALPGSSVVGRGRTSLDDQADDQADDHVHDAPDDGSPGA